MFAVIFEVRPDPRLHDSYLEHAAMLRPELEAMDGFVDNVRYRSLVRPGTILSLSSWRDEKALVRWRIRTRHHLVQQKGRDEILLDYHLRVGQLTDDTHLPDGCVLLEQRLDETETGAGTTIALVSGRLQTAADPSKALDVAIGLGLVPDAPDLVAWDVYGAVLAPGDLMLLMTWRDARAAEAFAEGTPAHGTRRRRVRVVRDYGMFDRHEAPQYYPDAVRRPA